MNQVIQAVTFFGMVSSRDLLTPLTHLKKK